jgi:hypothetical protein
MATTLQDISQAWEDYVQHTIVTTITTTGVPSGQTEFNPKEKVTFDLNVINGTSETGIEVKNIRLHLKADPDNGVFKFIVPDSSTGITAFSSVVSTTPLTASKDGEQDAMFIETSSLKRLKAGESVKVSGLEVIAKKAGTADLAADVHATLDFDTLFIPNIDGKDATKLLAVTT